MKIKRSQIDQIIKEEYERLIEEENLDEVSLAGIKQAVGAGVKGLGDIGSAVGSKLKQTASGMKQTYQTQAAAGAKAAEAEKVSATKEKAKAQVAKKIQLMKNKILDIETKDVDELYDLATSLGYDVSAGGDHSYMNPEPIRKAADQLAKRLDTILKDIQSGRLAEEKEE